MAKKHRKKRQKTSMTLISEILMNEEQRDKFTVEQENVDVKGYVSQLKVTDQTIFDLLFIEFLIEQPHHEAVVLFMEDVSRSGMYISSPKLDSEMKGQTGKKAANSIAERRMTFSSPYRFIVDDCGELRANILMKFINAAHTFPRKRAEKKDFAEVAAKLLMPSLKSLSKFYKTNRYRDPRRILATQSK